jgi:hypothetical protein
MLAALRRLAHRFRLRSLDTADYAASGPRRMDNVDGLTAARDQHLDPYGSHGGAPVNYVPPADEGRPPK